MDIDRYNKVSDVPSIMQNLVKKNQAYWEKQISDTRIPVNQVFNFRRGDKRRNGSNEDFIYVVERQEQSRICFLSGQERYRDSKEIIAPQFMDPETNGIIKQISNKVRSNRGVGGLVDLRKRFEDYRSFTPDAYKYDPYPMKEYKQLQHPFGTSLKKPKEILNTNPGPGYYETPKQCRRPRKKYCAKGMSIIPCVEIKCVPKPVDKCLLCQKKCTGDYWYSDSTTFLCLQCMRNERKMKTKFKLDELNRFKKIRNCSFAHQHEGTTAAIYLRTKSQLQRKFRIENYLNSYFNKYV